MGDRVALVTVETAEIAREAVGLIKVDYELLPAVIAGSIVQDPSTCLE